MPPPTSHKSTERRTQTAASGRASGSGERGSGAERNGAPSGSGPAVAWLVSPSGGKIAGSWVLESLVLPFQDYCSKSSS